MKPAILVGNGINNINNKLSWSALLEEIIRDVGADVSTDNMNKKPFPLFYEEIYISAVKNSGITEYALKEMISKKVGSIAGNEIHKRITSGIFSDIITTNYEYTLESCLINDFKQKNLGVVRETKYSIYRHGRINDMNFWHIHGDMHRPSSILLGYEQYSGQLQVMRNYVVSGTNYESKTAKVLPLTKRMGKKDYQPLSWIDRFFTGDLHIVGLSLDFIESDLWWLITYRARRIFEKPGKNDRYKGMRKALEKSRIYYYYPEKYYNREKMQLLEANGISTVALPLDNSVEFYDFVLDQVETKK